MRSTSIRLTAGVLAAAIFFAGPTGLAAKQRRGATLLVTKLDGTQVAGELIAVKPDSLLLLADGAADLSVPLADIHTLRIVRRSRAGLFAGVGAGAGFVGAAGVVLAIAEEDVVRSKAGTAALVGVLAAGIGAVAGALVGSVAGADTTLTVAGLSEADLAYYWSKLRAYSREGRLKIAPRRP